MFGIFRRANVIVLCTSNMEDCLDRALLDRADVVKHVGQPSANALYSILAKCIEELIRVSSLGIILLTGFQIFATVHEQA